LKPAQKKLFQNLIKSELLRNASILISGTVLAQLISILLQPFLRRYFTPEAYGTFSVYLSLVGILTVITTLRYDDAVVLPDNDSESANLLGLTTLFNFSINLILFIIVILWAEKIKMLLNLPEKFSYKILYLVPLAIFLYNTYLSYNYWLIRKKKFYSVSANKLIRRSFEGIAQIFFALVKNMKGLIFGDIFGQSANVATVLFQCFKNGFGLKYLSLKKMRFVFIKYSEFPRYNLIPAVMSACSYLLPPIFITKYFSAAYSGYFDLSKMLLSIPLALIATSFSNVLVQKLAEKYNKKESILTDLKPVLVVTLIICFFEILVIQLFGETLFAFVFGKIWKFSGQLSKLMVWTFVLNFIVSSFSCIFVAMRKIKIYGIWQFFYFIAMLSLLFFSHSIFINFLKIYVFIEVICSLILLAMMLIIVLKYESSIK
jgi:O-antigen/teichoic acid export membrane protein